MVIIMINEYKEKLNVINDILSNMPKTNKKNINEYKEKCNGILKVAKNLQTDLYEEITKRYDNIIFSIKKTDINEEENLKKLDAFIDYINLKDNMISPYKKLNIDKNIYELNINSNDNLKKLNETIINLLNIFRKCNINLTDKDFCYSYYSYSYMKNFFVNSLYNVDEEKMKEVFKNIYWKCPSVITHISLNFKYLYLKYEKYFIKYLNKMTSKIDEQEIRKSINQILIANNNLKQSEDIIFNNFYEGIYDIKDYDQNKIESLYKKFIKDDNDYKKYDNDLVNLYNSLCEYDNYLKYLFLINDIKEIYKDKEKYKQSVKKSLKEIKKEEKILKKYNKKFMSYYNKNDIKQDEYNLLINEKITELQNLYDEYENNKFCEKILLNINDSSSIYDTLKMSCYNYNFLIKSIEKENLENKDNIIKDLEYFLLCPYNTLIDNVSIFKNDNIEKVIQEHYKLLNIDCEILDESNVSILKKDLEKIIIYNSIINSNLNIDNIKFILDVKKNNLERENIK